MWKPDPNQDKWLVGQPWGSMLLASLDSRADASVVIVLHRKSLQMAEATIVSMAQPR